MKFKPAKELIEKADKEGYAVPAICAWNAEIINIILKTAEKMQSPVILMSTEFDFPILNPLETSIAASAIAELYTIPAAIHLDHAKTIELVKECVDAEFTSVMLDFSERSYEENVAGMKKVVEIAHPKAITVEGELGHVGRIDMISKESSSDESVLTDPDDALKFVKETNVDMLAVGIGNLHGIYTSLPKFDFDLLERIYEKTKIPLVLHGGSGTPVEDLKKSVSLGIRKVNIASELVNAYRNSLLNQWNNNQNLWAPTAFGEALKLLPPIIEKWMKNLGSAGRA